MSSGVSHITLIVSDLDRTQQILETVLKARCVYDSGEDTFSLSKERFYLVGDLWIATMEGSSLESRTYNHIAFSITEDEFEERLAKIAELGLEIKPPRPRVEGEGRSIYFYGPDNHLFELHTGTLEQRLLRYSEGKGVAA